MKQYLFMCCMCISAFGGSSTLNATSILIYLFINNTNMLVKIPSHNNVTIEKETISFLENAGYLKKLEVKTEDDAVKLDFEPPLEIGCRIELHEDSEDDKKFKVLVFGPGQPLE